jgi:hypothetical protein
MRFKRPLAALFLACLPPACTMASAAEPGLPPLARAATGVWRADLDGDGHEDLVVSHDQGYGVYLFVPPAQARAGLGWTAGWTRVMREGTPGDEAALPLLTGPDVTFADGVLQAGDVRMTYDELLRVPGPRPRSAEESLRTMRLPAGFTATLAAAEPLVMDPVFIDWDERGRMWVAEMGDYPFAEGEATSDGRITWRDGVPGEGAGRGLQSGRRATRSTSSTAFAGDSTAGCMAPTATAAATSSARGRAKGSRSAATTSGLIHGPENFAWKPARRSAASGGTTSATGSATTMPRPAGTTGCR